MLEQGYYKDNIRALGDTTEAPGNALDPACNWKPHQKPFTNA